MGLLARVKRLFRPEVESVLSAMALRVYEHQGGAAMIVSCDQGEVALILSKSQVVVLCDTLMETLEPAAKETVQ